MRFAHSGIVGSCASVDVSELGKRAHGLVVVFGYESSLFINNAFIGIYAECGGILGAKNMYNGKTCREETS